MTSEIVFLFKSIFWYLFLQTVCLVWLLPAIFLCLRKQSISSIDSVWCPDWEPEYIVLYVSMWLYLTVYVCFLSNIQNTQWAVSQSVLWWDISLYISPSRVFIGAREKERGGNSLEEGVWS